MRFDKRSVWLRTHRYMWDEAFSRKDSLMVTRFISFELIRRVQDPDLRVYLRNSVLSEKFTPWWESVTPDLLLDLVEFEDVILAYQVVGLWKKNTSILEQGYEQSLKESSYTKFLESEASCSAANRRLREARRANYSNVSPRIAPILHRASRKISRILGPRPCLEQLEFQFGPGANTTVRSTASSPRYKLGAKLACSHECASAVKTLLEDSPGLCNNMDDTSTESITVSVDIHAGRLQFVPKTATSLRAIVVEPILNSYAQKGIGKYIKDRLRRAGLDLGDQKPNQDLACEGSITGELATVDLSAASDTISLEVVAELLPLDWFSLLSTFRTGRVEYQGTTHTLEKFSSMGNAYTFELESLIFWALADSCVPDSHTYKQKVRSYGDDIIIPADCVLDLIEVLTFLGFSVNTEKSFWTGRFRESCGKDYVAGIDIRPFFLKSEVSLRVLYSMHNFFARDFNFELADVVKSIIPDDGCLYGPDGYGDGHLIGEPHVARKKTLKGRKRGWDGYYFNSYRLNPRILSRNRVLPGDRLLPAYSIYVRGDTGDNPLEPSEPVDHYVVRGHRGYSKISIYTLRRGIFF